jgi:hypothetical protein
MIEGARNDNIWNKPYLFSGAGLLVSGLFLNFGIVRWNLPLTFELLLPVLAVWLFATGAVLLCRPRRPTTEKRAGRTDLFVVLLSSTCITCVYAAVFLTVEMTDKGAPETHVDCEGLCQTVTTSVNVPPSISVPSRSAVFCQTAMFGIFLQRYDVILVYGVTERPKQDRAVQSLLEYREKVQTKPIRVEFFEKENWIPLAYDKEGKGIGGQRGPERLIRVATIR